MFDHVETEKSQGSGGIVWWEDRVLMSGADYGRVGSGLWRFLLWSCRTTHPFAPLFPGSKDSRQSSASLSVSCFGIPVCVLWKELRILLDSWWKHPPHSFPSPFSSQLRRWVCSETPLPLDFFFPWEPTPSFHLWKLASVQDKSFVGRLSSGSTQARIGINISLTTDPAHPDTMSSYLISGGL